MDLVHAKIMILSRKMRIIHVDDHKIFNAGLRSCLKIHKQEFFIQHYQNSHHAFDAFLESIKAWEPIDLIITDMNHMGQNGYEFAKAIRAFESSYLIRTPILLLTMQGPNRSELVQQMLQENLVDAYLPKSASSEEIIETIELLTGVRIN